MVNIKKKWVPGPTWSYDDPKKVLREEYLALRGLSIKREVLGLTTWLQILTLVKVAEALLGLVQPAPCQNW